MKLSNLFFAFAAVQGGKGKDKTKEIWNDEGLVAFQSKNERGGNLQDLVFYKPLWDKSPDQPTIKGKCNGEKPPSISKGFAVCTMLKDGITPRCHYICHKGYLMYEMKSKRMNKKNKKVKGRREAEDLSIDDLGNKSKKNKHHGGKKTIVPKKVLKNQWAIKCYSNDKGWPTVNHITCEQVTHVKDKIKTPQHLHSSG